MPASGARWRRTCPGDQATAVSALFSGPGTDGYARPDAVVAGPHGGALQIPEPFGMTLDATTLPLPR